MFTPVHVHKSRRNTDATKAEGGYFALGEACAEGVKNLVSKSTVVMTTVFGANMSMNAFNTLDAYATGKASKCSGVITDAADEYMSTTDIMNASKREVFHDSAAKTCVLIVASGLSSVCPGKVTAVTLGGRNSGVCKTDTYTSGSEVSGA